ncbi:MAG TPA: D-alanyl-D-alanine carboxypeptidase family protein [Stellaceae bacterium]|nr:D-alanyl-D-alanine carboxypeptidase family protein [Stellaceae bacterium]
MSPMRFSAVTAALCLAIWLPAAHAAMPTIDTAARDAYVIDFNTGAVLLDKNGDARIPPASMSKLMTEYIVFSYLKQGRATLNDMLPVSEKAWRTQGSKMFVPLGGKVRLEDLLQGMIVQSGNDACIVLAEGLAGSTDAFVKLMNDKAKELGMTGSHFADVDGLPDPDEYMTAHDLAILARHLITDFPEYYHYDSQKEFTFNGIKQGNRNPLLYTDSTVDGLKTGHTDEAGYCLTASALRNGRRVIEVLAGMNSMQARADQGRTVLDWAFREFDDYTIAKTGTVIDHAPVWMGQDGQVPVAVAHDVVITLPRGDRTAMKVAAIYDGPVPAPVAVGQPVGKLTISTPDTAPVEVPLVATQAVQPLSAFGRMAFNAAYLLFGRHN